LQGSVILPWKIGLLMIINTTSINLMMFAAPSKRHMSNPIFKKSQEKRWELQSIYVHGKL